MTIENAKDRPLIAARVYNSAAQTTQDGAPLTLSFDTVDRDDGGLYAGGSPTRLTAPVSGWYILTFNGSWASNGTGRRLFDFIINGTTHVGANEFHSNTTGSPFSTVTATKYLTAGQYAEVVAYQTSGGPLDVVRDADRSADFSMALIG